MGIVSEFAGVQLKTRLSCAFAVTVRAQMSTVTKTEKCFIRKVFAGYGGRPS